MEGVQRTKSRLPVVAGLSVLSLLLCDSLRRVGWQAEFTLAEAAIVAAVAPVLLLPRRERVGRYEPLNRHAQLPPPALWLFLAWSLAQLPRNLDANGFQNVILYGLLVLSMAVVSLGTGPSTPLRLLQAFRAVGVVGASIYLFSVAVGGTGANGIYNSRAYGFAGVVALLGASALAGPTRRSRLVPLLIVLAVALSLSRAALAFAVLTLLAFATRSTGRKIKWGRLGAMAAVASCGAYLAFTKYQPLHDRFVDNDSQSIGGFNIGTSGRTFLWRVTWEDIKESPIVGHGPGHAGELIFGVTQSIGHPHSDFLRLWDDLGLIGLVLFLLSLVSLVRGCYHRFRSATEPADKAVHLAGLLALLVVTAALSVDNLLTYHFVMLPVGALVGCSLGRALPPGPEQLAPPASHKGLLEELQARRRRLAKALS